MSVGERQMHDIHPAPHAIIASARRRLATVRRDGATRSAARGAPGHRRAAAAPTNSALEKNGWMPGARRAGRESRIPASRNIPA